MRRREILGAVVFFVFGSVTVILSLQMPIGTFRTAGPGLFPLCLGIMLMVLSSLFIVQVLLGAEGQDENDMDAAQEPGSPLLVVAFLAIVALTTLLMRTIGYPLASFLVMVGLLTILGLKRWPLNLALSFVIATGSYLVFVHVLKIPLPKGFLGI